MVWPLFQRTKKRLPSEGGYLEMTEGRTALELNEAVKKFRMLVSADMEWADSRKVRFRRRAAWIKVVSLVLGALSTIVLGVPEIPHKTAIALPMIAAVTLLNALEPFFNWRSRWLLMEETQYRLNRIRDEVDYYLIITPTDELSRKTLDAFYQEQQAVWRDVSTRWMGFRKLDQETATARKSDPSGMPPLSSPSE